MSFFRKHSGSLVLTLSALLCGCAVGDIEEDEDPGLGEVGPATEAEEPASEYEVLYNSANCHGNAWEDCSRYVAASGNWNVVDCYFWVSSYCS